MAFNTSARREDTSMKLRSQNIKQAKDMTRQLEVENIKMEQRLTELKMAIRRDREERGQTGFWGKGQEGSLGNYVSDVLSQPSSAKSERQSSGKKKKVKVLKDEPIAKPEKKIQPGSYGNIAMRETTPQPKIKGPKCGQCEQKSAHVSCHECGEDYCATCFAAFHLKGALRKHRSLPVGSNGALTVRSSSRASYYDGSGASGDVPPRSQRSLYSDADLSVLPANGRTPSPYDNGFAGPSLLDGNYDEHEAQASFQQALVEWRQGKATSGDHNSSARSSGQVRRESKTKAIGVEHGTSTEPSPGKKPLEINFKSDMTYAEKLLLKKLRREQQGLTSPVGDLDAVSSFNDSRPFANHRDVVDFDDAALDAEVERVSFEALANAVRDPSENVNEEEEEEEEEEERPESHVSIIEVKKGQFRESLRGLEHTAHYQVSEVPEDFVRKSQTRFSGSANKDVIMTPSPPSSARRRSPATRRHVRSPHLVTQTSVVHFDNSRVSPSHGSEVSTSRNSPRNHSRGTPGKRSTWAKTSREDLNFATLIASSDDPLKRKNRPMNRPPSRPGSQIKKGASLSKSKSTFKDITNEVPLDLSLEGHPLETTRTERSHSRSQGQRSQSRSGSASSRTGSRPVSRTKSRASLASIFGEGTLTKNPSTSLKEVADLAGRVKSPRYAAGVGDFLVAGVALPQEDRVLTPSGRRSRVNSARTDKWKVSYKLYDMGPRSWRPESSLGIAVGQVDPIELPRYYALRNPDPEVEKESRVSYALQNPGNPMFTSQDEYVMDLDTPRSEAVNLTPRSAFHETPRSVTFRGESPQSQGSSTFRVNRPATPGKTPRGVTPREDELPPVVVDGEDMSHFDEDRATSRQEQEIADTEALDQLEWELASQSGRIDADGNISRMSMASPEQEQDTSDGDIKTPEAQFDLNNQLRASVLMDDFEEMEQRLMEEEVKALH